MFNNDNKITSSLDLSHFETSKVTNLEHMFDGCWSLQYINLKNFDTPELKTDINMINKVSENVIVCINENNNIIIYLFLGCFRIPALFDKKGIRSILIF